MFTLPSLGAFLKLRGYRTPYDKSVPQPPEHVQALKRFRRKIRSVREMFNQFRDKNQDTDPFMTKEFVIQLKGTADEGTGADQQPDSPLPCTSAQTAPAAGAKRKSNGRAEEESDEAGECERPNL